MREVGLVFCGGGAKGSYEIGVWKALRVMGIEAYIKGVAGTSVGALNTALFAQNDLGVAHDIWASVSKDSILQINKAPEIIADKAIFSQEGLADLIDNNLDLNAISRCNMPAFATCCRLPHFEAEYFILNARDKRSMRDILLASSAIPGVYSPVSINGHVYVDGGISDNTPIKPLYDMGFREFIVVSLSSSEKVINTLNYLDSTFWFVSPYNHRKYFEHKTLDFNKKDIQMRMSLGYYDARGSLAKFHSFSD